MATLLPSDVPQPWPDAPARELTTLEHLRTGLTNDYAVLHGVHWSRAYERHTVFGEIDFVVVNRAGRVLLIEQKNGPLTEDEGGLTKHYASGPKPVKSQVLRSISAVRDKFAAQNPGAAPLEIDYLIYCPDYRLVNVNAAGVDAARVVDAAAADRLPDRIASLLAPSMERNDWHRELVEQFLCQSFRIAPDVSSHIASHRRVYTRMTEGLADVLDKLELDPYRLRVQGTAGAGKTQLTLRFAAGALRRGLKPLLVCFNRPLADRLARLAPEGTSVNTYLGFCTDAVRAAGLDVTFGPNGPEPGTWQDVQEQLVEAEIGDETKFDCLIVDEGQDFEPEWLEILKLFLTADAAILWLEDPLQNLRDTTPIALPGFACYRETANFRSPGSVGRFIERALGVEAELRNPLPGLGVAVHSYDDRAQQLKTLKHRINELVRQGFSHEEIAVVSCRGVAHAVFSDHDRLGSVPIRRFTGRYDDSGTQIYTEGKLVCETIFRFKGQQAPAVILTDIDESLADCERTRAVLYCGMTRATVRLEILVSRNSALLARLSGSL